MSSAPKEKLLQDYARMAQAMAAPARLALLEQLAQGERGVEALAEKTGLALANCSRHLQMLRQAGLVVSRRAGKSVLYRLADSQGVLACLDGLQRLAQRNLPQVEAILQGLSGGAEPPEPIGRDDLSRRLAEGAVTLIDLRPEDEFDMAHIPGALSVGLDGLQDLAASLPAQAEVVAYCRGPFCILSHQAEAALVRMGRKVRRMAGGLPEWRDEGRPVEGLAANPAG